MPPANDNFASAQAISTSLPQNLTGLTSVDTTEETGEPAPYFGLGGSDTPHAVWFSFTPNHTAQYRINMYNNQNCFIIMFFQEIQNHV